MKLGKRQKKLLDFLTKYPEPHYISTDRVTLKIVESLLVKGLITRVYSNMYTIKRGDK